ncbi:MAG: cysteine desulfurase family protein [Bryobacteraceae bacterium]
MNRFYFDHNATTPVSPEVLDVYLPVLMEDYGNASSIHHYGQIAKQKLETARRQTAQLIGCGPREVVFLSGGTEANNLAIFGTKPRHIITTAIEHPSVLNTCAQQGADVTYVPVGSSGLVDPDDIRRAIRPDTGLISVMHVNNEIGTIQPISEIAGLARAAGVLMHSDGVQAAGRIPVNVNELGVDLYSMSAHKMYAPKGTGALYVRKGTPLEPMLYGGRHEQQRRAGTENVAGAAALGAACAMVEWMDGGLRDRLEQGIVDRIPDVTVNGDYRFRSPNTTNLCFDGVEGESLVIALDLRGFAVSTGSACSSGAVEPSHVLIAIGLPAQKAKSSLRFSLGRANTVEQVDGLIEAVCASVAHLRRLSPAYISHV